MKLPILPTLALLATMIAPRSSAARDLFNRSPSGPGKRRSFSLERAPWMSRRRTFPSSSMAASSPRPPTRSTTACMCAGWCSTTGGRAWRWACWTRALIPGEFADAVRARAEKLTGIPAERIMLSATHTHSAPSLMRCLGTDADPNYPAFALPRIVEGLQRAVDNLGPARVGWAVALGAGAHAHARLDSPAGQDADRSVRRRDRPRQHASRLPEPGHHRAAGPSDPALTLLAVQSPDGRPIAVLANYSMHYFGAAGSLGGLLRRVRREAWAADRRGGRRSRPSSASCRRAPAVISIGWTTAKPKRAVTMDAYAGELAQIAADAYKTDCVSTTGCRWRCARRRCGSRRGSRMRSGWRGRATSSRR